MKYSRSLAVVLLTLSACKGLNQYQDKVATDKESLRGALKFEERLEQGGSWTIPSERQLTHVDYRSALVVFPDKDALKRITARQEDVLPPLTPEEQFHLDSLKKNLELARGIDKRSDDILAAVRKARAKRAAGLELAPQDVADLQAAMIEESAHRVKIADFLFEWVANYSAGKFKRGTKEFNDQLRKMSDRFFKDSTDKTKDVLFNVEEFSKLIDEESKAVLKRTQDDIAAVKQKSSVSLRLRAWDKTPGSSKPLPLHIDNYDDIDNGIVAKQERVSFNPSPADQDRIQKGWELASSASTFINDMRTKGSTLRQEISQLLETIRAELRKLPGKLEILAKERIDALLEASGKLAVLAGVTAEERKAAQDLQALLEKFRNAQDGWIQFKDQVEKTQSVEDLIRLWTTVTQEVDALRKLLIALKEDLTSCVAALERFESLLKERLKDTTLDATIRGVLQKALDNFLPQSKSALSGFIANQAKNYGPLAQYLLQLGAAATGVILSDPLESLPVDPRVKPLQIDKVLPGTIHIDNTPADHGDKIELMAELVAQDTTVLSRETWDFPVERFGLNSAFSTQLVFVNRIGTGDPGDPSVRYQAAPAVSWMLHYNVRTEPGAKDFGSHFWSFVNPGIGLNAAALRFNPSGVDFGVGGQVTLFQDILVGGYGYNFQAHKDRRYFFIGIGLLEALDGVGTLMGFSAGREHSK